MQIIGILGYSVLAFIAGLLLLVTSSMGINRSIECEQYKESNKDNDTWLTVMIVVSALMLIGSGIGFFLSIKKDPVTFEQFPTGTTQPYVSPPQFDTPPPQSYVSPPPQMVASPPSFAASASPIVSNILGDPNTIKNINSIVKAAMSAK